MEEILVHCAAHGMVRKGYTTQKHAQDHLKIEDERAQRDDVAPTGEQHLRHVGELDAEGEFPVIPNQLQGFRQVQ